MSIKEIIGSVTGQVTDRVGHPATWDKRKVALSAAMTLSILALSVVIFKSLRVKPEVIKPLPPTQPLKSGLGVVDGAYPETAYFQTTISQVSGNQLTLDNGLVINLQQPPAGFTYKPGDIVSLQPTPWRSATDHPEHLVYLFRDGNVLSQPPIAHVTSVIPGPHNTIKSVNLDPFGGEITLVDGSKWQVSSYGNLANWQSGDLVVSSGRPGYPHMFHNATRNMADAAATGINLTPAPAYLTKITDPRGLKIFLASLVGVSAGGLLYLERGTAKQKVEEVRTWIALDLKPKAVKKFDLWLDFLLPAYKQNAGVS